VKLKVTVSSESPVLLPLHYNYVLQSFIYRNLDKIYSTFLHNYGFPYKSRLFKLLTFSKIFGKSKVSKSTKKITFFPPIHFYVSCVLKEVLSSHAKMLIKREKLQLGRNRVYVEGIEVVEEKFKGNKVTVKTLSPVTIHSTTIDRKTIYYNPFQEKFYELLGENLKKKCSAVFKEVREVKIRPAREAIFKKAVVLYKEKFVVEAWKGKFEIEANPEAIEIALNAGIGDRNSQGFGMVAICES